MIAVGLFVIALVVVGVLLLTNPGSDDNVVGSSSSATPSTETSILASATARPSPTAGSAAPGSTPVPQLGASSLPSATSAPSSTSTEEQFADPTATSGEQPVDADPADEPELIDEPEASEDPVEEPIDEPDGDPVVGDFGTLPPAQIVSGGLARDVDLAYEMGIPLESIPSSATAFRLYWAGWSAENVASVASKVNVTADVAGSNGSYEAIGDDGQLYVSRTVVQYINSRSPVGGLLEENRTVIENARIWLVNSGITAGNIGDGVLIGRDDAAQRAVVLFKPSIPAPLLAFYPSATVTIGPGGDVREANIRWPDGYDESYYEMRSANQIWNDVLAGEGSIEADLSSIPGSGVITGTLTVYDASVAFSFAVAADGSEYLVPLVVLSGEIYVPEYDVLVPASLYIHGLYGQSSPRG